MNWLKRLFKKEQSTTSRTYKKINLSIENIKDKQIVGVYFLPELIQDKGEVQVEQELIEELWQTALMEDPDRSHWLIGKSISYV